MLMEIRSVGSAAVLILGLSACAPGEPSLAYHSAEQCSGISEDILDAGLDPSDPLPDSEFPAAWVVARSKWGSADSCVASLELLLENGAEVTGSHGGLSVLGYVSVHGGSTPVIVDLLVGAGADPCLSIEDHLNLDSPRYEGVRPGSLAESARIAGSSDAMTRALEIAESSC